MQVLLTIGHKNPEYTINGKLGDRKGVESENGIILSFVPFFMPLCKKCLDFLLKDEFFYD